MSKKALIYTSFDNPDDWLTYGDVEVADGVVRLTGVEPVLIRANDFVDATGASKPMPVDEYPAGSGKYAGNPAQDTYYYNFPDAAFGNAHSARMQVVEKVITHADKQGISVYPRDDDLTYHMKRLYWSDRCQNFRKVNGVWVDYGGYNYRVWAADEWANMEWSVLNKHFFDMSITAPSDSGTHWHSVADPRVADPTTPRGRLDFLNWTSDEVYLRSPGREYEDTTNPAILQLWPYKTGYVLPKNSANKYWEVTQVFHDACIVGTAEVYFQTVGLNADRHLFSATVASVITSFAPFYLIFLNENFGLSDGVIDGAYFIAPDHPDVPPTRINHFVDDTSFSFLAHSSHPAVSLTAGDRIEVYVNRRFPIFAEYPIDEITPSIFPAMLDTGLSDYMREYPPNVGAKYCFGVWLNNYHNPEDDVSISEISLILSPTLDVSRPVFESYSRNGLTGTATVSGVSSSETVYAYSFSLLDSPQQLDLVGSRTGNGDIDLIFPDDEPRKVLLISKLDDSYSLPSEVIKPDTFINYSDSPPTITNVVEKEDSVDVSVSGADGTTILVYYTWEGGLSWHLAGKVVGSGTINIEGLEKNKKYHFIALNKYEIT